MTAPTFEHTMNIMHVIDGTIKSGGKVFLHCHAGLGRTGLIIACYLVYSDKMTPRSAIRHVRLKRYFSL